MTDDRETGVWGNKDGRAWRIGGEAEVAWIRENTEVSFAITSAIPPIFEAYATLELPGSGDHLSASPLEDPDRHNAAVLAVLSEHSAAQPWWLGYLDTGAANIVFYDVPKVRPGPGGAWYVLVEADPEQARVWRKREHWKSPLPDLMFPADHSWLVSTLWDDDWTCLGGSRGLVDAFLAHPDLRHRAREVDPSLRDATPPGHTVSIGTPVQGTCMGTALGLVWQSDRGCGNGFLWNRGSKILYRAGAARTMTKGVYIVGKGGYLFMRQLSLLFAILAIGVCVMWIAACGNSSTGDPTKPRESITSLDWKILLVPYVKAGFAGWCMTFAPGGNGCPILRTSRGAIFAESWGVQSPPTIARGLALTTSRVTAVTIGRGSRIPTRAESQLPNGLRAAAVAVEVHEPAGQPESGFNIPFHRFTPLDSEGKIIAQPIKPGPPLAVEVGARHWRRPQSTPHSPCQISAVGFRGHSAQEGNVVTQINAHPELFGEAFLSCADSVYYLDNWLLDAGILLDASHPGATPGMLPEMKPIPGHRGIFAAASAGGTMLARRVPDAWLVVSGGSGLQQRLTLLDHLRTTIHL